MQVIYEDNHIIVVVKPPNVLTQADNTGDDCLLEQVREYIRTKYNKPGNVYVGLLHRLDRPVGGLLVFAKTSKAASRLSDDIRNNNIDRKYMAVVHGKTPKQNVVESYLLKDTKTNMVKSYNKEVKGSKKAKLSYETLEFKNDMSLVEITLYTGRSHQIRVQMSSSGYPIYGDMRYGKQEKGNIALFCYKLTITHPTKKEKMEFVCMPTTKPFTDYKSASK